MTYEDWVEKYRPIQNPFQTSASFENTMFETHGREWEFVRLVDPSKVWTLIASDGATYISAGFHFVNRLGYFVAEIPFEVGEMEHGDIRVDEDEEFTVKLNSSELNTVLAALRLWQMHHVNDGIPQDLLQLSTDGGRTDELDFEAIDALCERINLGN